VLDDALLVTSELVTNAHRYGRGLVELWLTLSDDEVRLEVLDRSPNEPERRDGSVDAEGGRGLMIVDAIASDWGVVRLGEAKSVWVLLPIRRA
jgi:anti-sigma regulatory factor (Ser/Thr protein kinase)